MGKWGMKLLEYDFIFPLSPFLLRLVFHAFIAPGVFPSPHRGFFSEAAAALPAAAAVPAF